MSNTDQALLPKLRKIIADSGEPVFLPVDFAAHGDIDEIKVLIDRLIDEGLLVPIGEGLVARCRRNLISGKPMLDAPGGFDEVAKTGLTKLGIDWEPGSAEMNYQNGATQIPVRTVVKLKGCGAQPQIGYGKFRLRFEPI